MIIIINPANPLLISKELLGSQEVSCYDDEDDEDDDDGSQEVSFCDDGDDYGHNIILSNLTINLIIMMMTMIMIMVTKLTMNNLIIMMTMTMMAMMI